MAAAGRRLRKAPARDDIAKFAACFAELADPLTLKPGRSDRRGFGWGQKVMRTSM